MERARHVALFCAGRTVVVGWLAIAAVMFSFSHTPEAAFRLGATLGLMLAAMLVARAATIGELSPERTPVWLYLDETSRPTDARSSALFSETLREVYGRYAGAVLMLSCVFFASSMALAGLDAQMSPMQDVAALAR